MNKKIVALLIVGAVVVIGVVISFSYASQRKVTFDFDNTDYAVEILNEDSNVIKTLKEEGTVRLAEGSYGYRVSGEGIEPTRESFEVQKDDLSIRVTSELSAAKKESLSDDARPEVVPLLTSLEKNKQARYQLRELTPYGRGEWMGGVIQVAIPGLTSYDEYRFLLKKEGDTWSVTIPPTIAIYKNDYKNVPEAIIDDLYTL